LNQLDTSILHYFISVSKNLPAVNSFMRFIVDNELLKGGIVVSLLWYLWFRKDDNSAGEKRQRIILTLMSCIFAVFVARLLTNVLPFRLRPLVSDNFKIFYPYNSMVDGLSLETSLPSDHAVLFYALATGIFLVSKKEGILAYLYVSLIICLPRVYLGLHYPTDILLGAAIGVIITIAFFFIKIWQPVTTKIMQFSEKYPGLFYSLFFLISFEIGSLFDSLREAMHFLLSTLKTNIL